MTADEAAAAADQLFNGLQGDLRDEDAEKIKAMLVAAVERGDMAEAKARLWHNAHDANLNAIVSALGRDVDGIQDIQEGLQELAAAAERAETRRQETLDFKEAHRLAVHRAKAAEARADTLEAALIQMSNKAHEAVMLAARALSAAGETADTGTVPSTTLKAGVHYPFAGERWRCSTHGFVLTDIGTDGKPVCHHCGSPVTAEEIP